MRLVPLASAVACAAALAVAATPAAGVSRGLAVSPAGDAGGDPRARLAACRDSQDPMGRSLTVDASMRSVRAGDRMQMRFDLYQRLPRARRFQRLPGPGLGTWNPASPGVQRFRFHKAIQNLPAPASYYVKVLYRWRDDTGHNLVTATRQTGMCAMSDLRPDLRIAELRPPRHEGPGRYVFPIVVRNAGRGASRDFDVLVTVGEQSQPLLTVAGLAPGERRLVEVIGTRCPPGTAGTVQLDPDNRVDEPGRRNNVRAFTCP
jgi:hypothetical protein